ncbi:MAG TPA: PsiF family protein [Steroidobacteraceae bacterium]|nr:PsiF family protein [Steroidobacteraceae bacterium]
MKLFSVLTCATLLAAGTAFAADTTAAAPATAPSAKSSCSKDATAQGLHGKARKAAIKKCMKAAGK